MKHSKTQFLFQSPVKCVLYAQLDGNCQPKSYCAVGSGFLIGSSVSSKNKKTLRHRRNGSGSFAPPPKYSPTRDRRYQSEPENRKVQLVERQTQTDAMDVSETDISPSAEHPNVDVPPPNHRQLPLQLQRVQQLAAVMAQAKVQASSPASVASPSNGNSLSNSELTYQDACSSPDQLIDDVMNSNERLDITDCCSDNENLERLGRKVIEFINENRLSIQSNTTENGNGGNGSAGGGSAHSTAAPDLRDVGVNSSPCLSRCNSTQSRRQSRHQLQTENTANSAVSNANGDSSHEHLGEDSWSDEEGEDTDHNFALRRRR